MKIRGNTIGTTIKPEKNILKATDLTEAEKKQVRENIGAVAVGEGGVGSSDVYVGSGEMPEGYKVQIDPSGDIITLEALAQAVADILPAYDGTISVE